MEVGLVVRIVVESQFFCNKSQSNVVITIAIRLRHDYDLELANTALLLFVQNIFRW